MVLLLDPKTLVVESGYREDPTPDPLMVDSVRMLGVRVPVLVAPRGGQYVVVDGRRRVLAARQAGLPHIPAVEVPQRDGATTEVIANSHRQPFSLPEMARIGVDLVAKHLGVSPEEARHLLWRLHRGEGDGGAEEALAFALTVLGISRSYWYGHVLPSLGWPRDVQEAAKTLSVRAAKALAAIRDEELRARAASAAQKAMALGKSPLKAIREVVQEAHATSLAAREADAHDLPRPMGWREPEGRMAIEDGVYGGEALEAPVGRVRRVGRLWDGLGVVLSPIAAAYVLAITTSPGERVLILWGGGGEIGDIAAATGRAIYWAEPLGMRREQVPVPPWGALPRADVAIAIPPQVGGYAPLGLVPEGEDITTSPEVWEDRVKGAIASAARAAREVYVVIPGQHWEYLPVRPVSVLYGPDGEVLIGRTGP